MYQVIVKRRGKVDIVQPFSHYQTAKIFLMGFVTHEHVQYFVDEFHLVKDGVTTETIELKFVPLG